MSGLDSHDTYLLFHDFLVGQFGDGHRSLRLRLEGRKRMAPDLLPQRIELRECINEGLHGTVTCLSRSAEIAVESLIGLPAEVQIVTDQGQLRRLCGIVSQAEAGPSDGGFALYRLTVVDALAVLRLDSTTRVFRDTNVVNITSTLLDEARARSPGLARTFAYDITRLRWDYPARGFTLQFNESRAAFLQRLWKQAGISWYIQPLENADIPAHTLVLFDRGTSLPECAAGTIRYHGDRATEQRDSIDLFTDAQHLVPAQLSGRSFDYLSGADWLPAYSAGVRVPQGEVGDALAAGLQQHSIDAPHLGDTSQHYQHLGDVNQQRLESAARKFVGESGVRDLAVGEFFTLDGHPAMYREHEEQREFIVTELTHFAENNFPHGLDEPARALAQRSGWARLDAPAWREGGRYGNRFVCQRRTAPLVPAFDPAIDLPRPPVLMARVVGVHGEPVHCDAHGRIKVQFLGLRAEDHEHAQGVGCSGTEADSAWVRWASPWAGTDRGWFALPRAGDGVAVGFVGGHPDKPFVLASFFGGEHTPPAFSDARALPGNRHLSGVKTQEIRGRGYNQLRFDDTPGQLSAQLASTHGASQFNAGYLTTPRRDGQAQPRGEGIELRTDCAGAIRAARGLLLTTAAQPGADGAQLERDELLACLTAAQQLTQTLADIAKRHHALACDPAAPATVQTALTGWDRPGNEGAQAGGEPVLAITAPAGIAMATPTVATVYAGGSLNLVAGDALQQTVSGQWVAQVGRQIGWFVQGNAGETAVNVIAGHGNVHLRAHEGNLEHSASNTVRLDAGKRTIITAADGPLTLIGGNGCQLKFENGNAELTLPGKFTVKAAKVRFQKGASVRVPYSANVVPATHWIGLHHLIAGTGEPVAGADFDIHFKGGPTVSGTLDADGRAREEAVPGKRVERIDYHPRPPCSDLTPAPPDALLTFAPTDPARKGWPV